MTYFIQNLQNYLIDKNLIESDSFIEFYDGEDALTCLSVYDTNPEEGKYSVQILRRDLNPANCLDKLTLIYNHFFDFRQPKPTYKVINHVKCLFKPISKPLFLKKENGFFYYTFNIEVWTQR